MDGEGIFANIIMILCGFGCGGVFYAIAVWAEKRKDPMHFYSGSTVDPKTISDIPAYNRANAKMWKCYAIPYLFAGVTGILGFFDSRLPMAGIAAIFLACTAGLGWLVRKYNKICDTYMIR